MIGMNALTGRALSGLAHIRQSLADILTTPLGSRVMRRDYGSEVPELIDQPLNSVTQLRLYAATAYAVQRWEPRIRLTSLQLDYNAAGRASLSLQGITEQQSVELTVPLNSDQHQVAA
ncbi:GPW/gp25 family protein [Solimicrobium silvestre]|uniref:Phage baseplate assembly protein W n=1 Tax=Solimicrobium silvestre TaxID=2099400 RepID=A0A2S9GTD2_9BURK|nr:GPW/gp25 family protein [Solimicrobium silvestre]PRC90974.1 Phage baseplate assembly protein W [Solimicrobium silvestre]